MLPNRASGPQNQPKAKVAVSVFVGAAASMGGMAVMGVAFPCKDSVSSPPAGACKGMSEVSHPLLKEIITRKLKAITNRTVRLLNSTCSEYGKELSG
jgi:hypothetical protein